MLFGGDKVNIDAESSSSSNTEKLLYPKELIQDDDS